MPRRVGGIRGSSSARWDRKLSPAQRRKLNRKSRRNSAPTKKAAAAKAKTRSGKQEHGGQKSRPTSKVGKKAKKNKTLAKRAKASKQIDKKVNQDQRRKQSSAIGKLQGQNKASRVTGIGRPKSVSKTIKSGPKKDRTNAEGYGKSFGWGAWASRHDRRVFGKPKTKKKNTRANNRNYGRGIR